MNTLVIKKWGTKRLYLKIKEKSRNEGKRQQGDSRGMPYDWFYWKFQVRNSVERSKVLTSPSRF
jgi:hypothetical protein